MQSIRAFCFNEVGDEKDGGSKADFIEIVTRKIRLDIQRQMTVYKGKVIPKDNLFVWITMGNSG